MVIQIKKVLSGLLLRTFFVWFGNILVGGSIAALPLRQQRILAVRQL